MTKAQAIRELKGMGVADIVPDGKFCIWATLPSGERGLFDPYVLLDSFWKNYGFVISE